MILSNYDSNWPVEFRRLEQIYKAKLGNLLSRTEHVGSTSIRGIAAKPIIDIDLAIFDLSDFSIARDRLESLGYRHTGDQGVPGREAFKRSNDKVPTIEGETEWMNHHLYVCVEGNPELIRHTRFRDYLNDNAVALKEYEGIKRDAESRSNGNRKTYANIKENEGKCSDFIERVLKKAEQRAAPNAQ